MSLCGHFLRPIRLDNLTNSSPNMIISSLVVSLLLHHLLTSEVYSNVLLPWLIPGGTAGCVLARRLAEDSSCKVLLIERGDARDNWLDRFPLPSTHHFSDGKHSMVLKADMLENTVNIVTGKGLGGTSRINAMQYSRGAPGEYNAWAQSGRKGWSYNELLPYFERNECLYNPVTQTHYGSKGDQCVCLHRTGY